MATTTTITTTYAGEKKRGYIATALLSANTIENGGVSVNQNVKYKEVIKQMAVSGLIADGTCDFDATGAVVLTERYLEPEEFQVNMQLCKKDFRSDWEAISMGYSAWDNLPPDFQTFLVARVIAQVAEANERILWQGDAGIGGEYDGFLTLMAADAGVVNNITGISIDATNVVDELGKIVDLAVSSNEAIISKEDAYIYIPQNVYRAYIRSLGGFGAAGLGAAGLRGEAPWLASHGGGVARRPAAWPLARRPAAWPPPRTSSFLCQQSRKASSELGTAPLPPAPPASSELGA